MTRRGLGASSGSGIYTALRTRGKVVGLLADKSGNIWISTHNGISRFSSETKKFRNYDVSDGLQSNHFFFHGYGTTGAAR